MKVFFKTSFILIVTLFFSMVCLSQSLLEQAFDAQKKGEHEKAIKLYNQVIEVDSKNFVAHFNLGLIYFQTKRFSESIKHFNAATDIDPTRPEPYFGKANAYLEIQNISKALETLHSGEQACEKIVPYWLMRAQLEIRFEELGNAKLSVNRAYSLNPNEIDFLIHIGKLFSELKEFSKAEEVFDTANQKHPDNFLVLSERIRLFATTGKTSKALQEVESAINRDKLNARLYVLASSIFIDNSKQSALEWLNKGLSENAQPKNEILLKIAEIYFKDKSLDHAMKTIDEVLINEPENLFALTLKTRVYLQKNENEKALDVIEKIYNLNNRSPEFYELRFLTLQANSKHEEAFFALRTWITQHPYDPKPYHILANLLIESKAFGDACLILESLLSFRPFDMQALEMYAQSATLVGKADVAIDFIESAISNGHKSADLLFRLGLCYRQNAESVKAIAVFKQMQREYPSDTRGWMLEASTHEQRADFENALKVYKDFDEKHPRNPFAREGIAKMLSALEQHESAAGAWLAFAEVAPNPNPSYLRAANEYVLAGKKQKADEMWEELMKSREDDYRFLAAYGTYLIHQEEYKAAETIYRKLMLLEPDKSGAFLTVAEILVKQDKLKESFSFLVEHIEKFYSDERYINYMKSITQKLEAYEEYEGIINKLIANEKYSMANMREYVDIAFRRNKLDEAIVTLEKAGAKYPKNTDIWLALARCSAYKNDATQSLIYMEKAVDSDPTNGDNLRTFALAAESGNDAKRAVKAYGMLLELQPENTGYALKQAGYLIQLNEKQKAKEVVEKVLKRDPKNEDAIALLKVIEKQT